MANFIKDWTNKDVEVLTKSYRRYSFVVNILKYVLPVLALVLLVVMFVFADAPDTGGNIAIEPIEKDGKREAQVMLNPRFHGVDSHDQSYNIFAKSAFQENKEQVKLKEINADLTTNNGSWVSLVADSGDYDITHQFLELFGEVSVFVTRADFSGYEIDTSEAKIDIKNKLAHGEKKVLVKSDLGIFTASGFKAFMAEEKIAFTGPIKLVIYR